MNPISDYYSKLGKKSAKGRDKTYYSKLGKLSAQKRHEKLMQQSPANLITNFLKLQFAS